MSSDACLNCTSTRASTDLKLASTELAALNQQRIVAEGIRAKELEAHGELTRRLQVQLDSHRHNERELQLTIAKVRAEKCRFEAELTALQSKSRLLEQGSEGRELRHEKLVDDYRERLLGKENEIETLMLQIQGLLVEKVEATMKLTEKQSREEAQELSVQRLTSQLDETKHYLHTSALEIASLTAELSKKQSEIDQARVKSDELLIQLEEQKNNVLTTRNEVSELTRAVEKLESSRLRLAGWKRARWDIQRRDLLFQSVFLEWKTEMLTAKAIRTHHAKTTAARRCQRIEKVRLELSTKLIATKSTLQSTKTWLQGQQQELRSWTELSMSQFTTLVMSRLKDQQLQADQRHAHAVESLQYRLEEQQKQHDQVISAAKEAEAVTKIRHKQRVEALVGRIQALQEQRLRFVAFQGWKDVYLRNLVAETTHAVMVARAANSIVAASRPPRSGSHPALEAVASTSHSTRASPKACATELRRPQLAIDPHAREVEEDHWKRWRRVTPTETISKQDVMRSRRSSITSSASRTSTKVSTPTSQASTTTKIMSTKRNEAVDAHRGPVAHRRASII